MWPLQYPWVPSRKPCIWCSGPTGEKPIGYRPSVFRRNPTGDLGPNERLRAYLRQEADSKVARSKPVPHPVSFCSLPLQSSPTKKDSDLGRGHRQSHQGAVRPRTRPSIFRGVTTVVSELIHLLSQADQHGLTSALKGQQQTECCFAAFMVENCLLCCRWELRISPYQEARRRTAKSSPERVPSHGKNRPLVLSRSLTAPKKPLTREEAQQHCSP